MKLKFVMRYQCNYIFIFLKVIVMSSFYNIVNAIHWDHSIDLNDDYRVLWNIVGQEITFEVQVRTLGYIGLGFSPDGKLPGSDVVIGWVNQGQAHFQDRHVKRSGDVEPVVDPSQDYVLMLGYENATHTVMRFKRKLDTCDMSYDVPITNDTIRLIYMYDENDPRHGSVVPGNLPNPQEAFKGYRSLFLTQKPKTINNIDADIKVLELRNDDVVLPLGDDSLYWCKMFKLQDIYQKSHVIKYEPVFDSLTSEPYLQHIILYECQGSSTLLEQMSRERGRPCYRPNTPPLNCNAIVATWAKGSEGFVFPMETGYALDINQARFYLMETHYNNPRNVDDFSSITMDQKADNSGLKLFYIDKLRKYDAGVLSIGIDQNWRHIIPPFQETVISEGHCIGDCTSRAFPRHGISIFAVMMRTHMIGKQMKLRHLKNHEEFTPIAIDRNIDSNYQEFRRLSNSVRVMPGDRLITECIYNSSLRDQITLGGMSMREESCIVLTYYYPRQKRLTTCHSLPSLPTVMHSLGIEELAVGSNPVLIAMPEELAGMTLESRLISYDWKNQFDSFQKVTQSGTFKTICWDAKNIPIPDTDKIEGTSPNITKKWYPPISSCIVKSNNETGENDAKRITNNNRRQNRNDNSKNSDKINIRNDNSNNPIDGQNENFNVPYLQINENNIDDMNTNNIFEGAARTKVSRSFSSSSSSSSTESMGFNASNRIQINSIAIIQSCVIFILFILNS